MVTRWRREETAVCHYHPISFVFDGVDEAAKLFKWSSDNDLVISLAVADALELEAHQAAG